MTASPKGSGQFSKSVSLGLLVVGAVIGLSLGMALGKTVNCSHVELFCYGTSEADTIYGWDNINDIDAKAGRDRVWAYANTDSIEGKDDADDLNGGEGPDYVYGEYGNDSYLWVSEGGVYGQSQNDHLFGGVGEDVVEGNFGNDVMFGNEHDDILLAEDGMKDEVDGNSGTDTCYVDGYDAWEHCTPK